MLSKVIGNNTEKTLKNWLCIKKKKSKSFFFQCPLFSKKKKQLLGNKQSQNGHFMGNFRGISKINN